MTLDVGAEETIELNGSSGKSVLRLLRAGKNVGTFLLKYAFRGVIMATSFGILIGLAMGILGPRLGLSQETMMVTAAAMGYVAGVVVMVIILIMSALEIRSKRKGSNKL